MTPVQHSEQVRVKSRHLIVEKSLYVRAGKTSSRVIVQHNGRKVYLYLILIDKPAWTVVVLANDMSDSERNIVLYLKKKGSLMS